VEWKKQLGGHRDARKGMVAFRVLPMALVAAGAAVTAAAVLRRWKKNGTIDDVLERVAFQIWRYAQKYELRCRPKRIFLLRHGESEGNIDKTVCDGSGEPCPISVVMCVCRER